MPKKISEEFNNLGNGKNPANSNRIDFFCNYKPSDQTSSNNSVDAPRSVTNKKPEHKANQISVIAKTATVVVATLTAASIGVSGVVDILPTNENVKIEIFAEENFVSYFVELEGYKDGDVYTVTIHNDFTNREQVFEYGQIEGYEEGLKPHMYYTMTVKKGKKIVAVKTFKTESQREKHDDYYQDDNYTSDDKTEPRISDDEVVIEEGEDVDPTTGRN